MTPGMEGQRRRRTRDQLVELGSSSKTRETLRRLEEHQAELFLELDAVVHADDTIETEHFCAR